MCHPLGVNVLRGLILGLRPTCLRRGARYLGSALTREAFGACLPVLSGHSGVLRGGLVRHADHGLNGAVRRLVRVNVTLIAHAWHDATRGSGRASEPQDQT